MNLEDSIKWLANQVKEIEAQGAPEKQIETYKKFYCWLDELERYRLMMSELTREIEYSKQSTTVKAQILQLIGEELRDWKLTKDQVIE